MRLGSTSVVWLKSGLSHLFRISLRAKTVRLTATVGYVKKGVSEQLSGTELGTVATAGWFHLRMLCSAALCECSTGLDRPRFGNRVLVGGLC
jgi:hypothetical protein